jgi:prolipoprotein diacylglyceryltransferase
MNPIFANLGIIEIRWYSVTMFLAMFIGGCLLLAEAEKYEITEDTLINFSILADSNISDWCKIILRCF